MEIYATFFRKMCKGISSNGTFNALVGHALIAAGMQMQVGLCTLPSVFLVALIFVLVTAVEVIIDLNILTHIQRRTLAAIDAYHQVSLPDI